MCQKKALGMFLPLLYQTLINNSIMKMIQYLWLTAFIVCVSSLSGSAFAQQISGQVIDAKTKDVIPYANVALEKLPMKRITAGGVTDMNGDFKFEASTNKYNLIVSVLGYQKKTIPNIDMNGSKLNLGKIALTPANIEISEVRVTGQRSYIENRPGKQILNVGREIAGGGGNVSQVLKIVPSVEVTPRGDISIRGNENIKILINGKEMTYGIDPAILLKQLPSSTVEKVEVITNASVSEDPESAGGAINIILKKNANDGFHYGINLEMGMTPFKGNGGFNMNYAKGKFNTYLTYGAYVDNYDFANKGERKITLPDSQFQSITDDGKGDYKDVGHLILGGIDYDISTKTKINMEFTHNQYKEDWVYDLNNVFVQKSGSDLNGIVLNKNKDNIRFTDVSVRLESKPREKHFFKSMLHFSGGRNKSTRFIDEKGSYFPDDTKSSIRSKSKFLLGEFNADYKLPVGESAGLEFGINSELVDYKADQMGKGSYTDNKEWKYKQQKHAAYFLYKLKLNKLTVGAGLRPEFYKSETREEVQNTTIKQEYTKIYPNLIVNYDLGDSEDIRNVSLSYSKRIRRPEAEELDPVADYANPSHIHQGNPHLKPEFVNSVELAYSRIKGKKRLNITLFGRQVTKVIQQQTELRPRGILYTTYTNHSSSKQLGIEFNGKIKPLKWWESTLGGSYMKSFFAKSKSDQNVARRRGDMWQLKWDNFINLNAKNTLQVQSQYYGKTSGMLYSRKPYNLVNLGFERKILNSWGTLGFSINDVFNSGGKEYYKVFGPGFISNSEWRLDSRTFRITFNYYLN
jgi:outer membrane receptor protein involved in Fe transport